jgi:hypothetical protein
MSFSRLLRTTLLSVLLKTAVSSPIVEKRCFADPSWDLTPENYQKAGADEWFQWWRSGKVFSSKKNVLQQIVDEFVGGVHNVTCPHLFREPDNCNNLLLSCASECLSEILDPNTAESHSRFKFKHDQHNAGLLCYGIPDKYELRVQ